MFYILLLIFLNTRVTFAFVSRNKFYVNFFSVARQYISLGISEAHNSLEKAYSDVAKYLRWSCQIFKIIYFLGIFLTFPEELSEAYSEPCQTSKMELFEKIINGLKECLPEYVQVVLLRMIYQV